MVFTPWNTAHGDASPALLRLGGSGTVDLSPADDSVDTNSVIIEGVGTISSFGDSPHFVMKRVKFIPLVLAGYAPGGGGGPSVTLVNSASLNLLGKKNRSFSDIAYGNYQCEGDGIWNEVYFAIQGTALLNELEERIAKLEAKINA